MAVRDLKVADEVWIATALLHREHPNRTAFRVREIVERAEREGPCPPLRPGVLIHASQHCVANKRPNPGGYRMLVETPEGGRRLYRPGDPTFEGRRGKIVPRAEDLPEAYRPLLEWYDQVYMPAGQPADPGTGLRAAASAPEPAPERTPWMDIMAEAERARRLMRMDPPAGEATFRSLRERFPRDGMVWFQFGEALEALDRRDEACAAFQTAARLFPWQRWRQLAREAREHLGVGPKSESCDGVSTADRAPNRAAWVGGGVVEGDGEHRAEHPHMALR